MARAAVSELVATELNILSEIGEPLDSGGPRATVNEIDPMELAVRVLEVGEQYRALQNDVASDGLAAIVTAGPPGSGKTSALEGAGLLSGTYRNIDPDVIKGMLIERALADGSYSDLLDKTLADGNRLMPMELSGLVHRESARIAGALWRTSLRKGENVILQGTLAWGELPKTYIEELERFGYGELDILDVEVPFEVALERSTERWWLGRSDLTNGLGGRFVPTRLLSELYLVDGRSKCAENAGVMAAISTIPVTTLRSLQETATGTRTVVETSYGSLSP